MKALPFLLLLCVSALNFDSAFADGFKLQTVTIMGGQEAFTEPGSIYQISEEEIKSKQSTNAHEILKDIPGVSIQQEDGLGLRPNIGLRGTHPHRSKKVTLLEDGVLIAPAPYSAPAAYYFPMMPKITGVEVYKGPSSVKYGPNSIGGAINLLTRDFSEKNTTALNYSYGSFNTQKMGAWTSGHESNFYWLVEGNKITSDGFKDLPGGGNTGLEKNDVLIKARYKLNTERERFFDFKYSWSEETSYETYLGITNEDFIKDPFQRYEASREDLIEWEHKQYQLKYFNEWSSKIFSEFSVYRHEFTRKWDKLNGFSDNTVDLRDVLNAPVGQNKDFLDVLKGQKDSSPSEQLRFGINDREYLSQGLSTETRFVLIDRANTKNNLDVGLLYHEDEVERSHLLQDAQVVSGKVSKSTSFIDDDNFNIDSSKATRIFAMNTFENKKIIARLGGRFENVRTERFDKITQQEETSRSENFFVPGAGLSYKINDSNIVFVGANRGYTLPGPGQSPQIEPEEAINYELGYRVKGELSFELIGFYSDYKNILGVCSFSTGCNARELDRQFNGGKAKVFGAELLTATELTYKDWAFPIRLSATYTDASFDSTLISTNKEWGVGQINPGDPLPYISEFAASLSLGFKTKRTQTNLFYNWKSKVFDQAVAANRLEIPAFSTVNANFRYSVNLKSSVYINVENVFNNEYVSSLRPFGARPGSPRWVSLGVTHSF